MCCRRFRTEGPAGQVIGEISAKADPASLPQVVEAAELLGFANLKGHKFYLLNEKLRFVYLCFIQFQSFIKGQLCS